MHEIEHFHFNSLLTTPLITLVHHFGAAAAPPRQARNDVFPFSSDADAATRFLSWEKTALTIWLVIFLLIINSHQ